MERELVSPLNQLSQYIFTHSKECIFKLDHSKVWQELNILIPWRWSPKTAEIDMSWQEIYSHWFRFIILIKKCVIELGVILQATEEEL